MGQLCSLKASIWVVWILKLTRRTRYYLAYLCSLEVFLKMIGPER